MHRGFILLGSLVTMALLTTLISMSSLFIIKLQKGIHQQGQFQGQLEEGKVIFESALYGTIIASPYLTVEKTSDGLQKYTYFVTQSRKIEVLIDIHP